MCGACENTRMARLQDHRVRRYYGLSGEVERHLIIQGLRSRVRDVLFYTKCDGKIMKALENQSAKNVVERG